MSNYPTVDEKTVLNEGSGKGGPKKLADGAPAATGNYVGFDVGAADVLVNWTTVKGSADADATTTDYFAPAGATRMWRMTNVTVSNGDITLIVE